MSAFVVYVSLDNDMALPGGVELSGPASLYCEFYKYQESMGAENTHRSNYSKDGRVP